MIIHYGFHHIIQFYFDLFEQHYITQYVIASVQHCINMIAASAARGREALANTASSNDEKIWTTAKNSVVRIAPRLRVNCKWPPMSYFCETGKMLCILKMNKTFF